MYIWNEAKWVKKLLEKYWNNYYFSSSQHKQTERVAHVCWQQRDSKDIFSVPLWLPSSSALRGKDRGRLAYWKVDNTMLVPLGWQVVILGKGGGWWGQWVSLAPSLRAMVLIPAGHRRGCQSISWHKSIRGFQHHKLFLWVVSCWPESSCPKMDQNKAQALWNFIHKIIMKVLPAKPRCLPHLLHPLTPAGPGILFVIPDILGAWGSGMF